MDLFFAVLPATAALVALIGGGPRVMLFRDAAVVGGRVLGTAFTGRPLAFPLAGDRTGAGRPARGPGSGGTAPRSAGACGC